MNKNIIFIGGIHGVGKSTVCDEIIRAFDVNYLSASSVIKWNEINEDVKNKKVENIPYTQDRLINGLRDVVVDDKNYLLDGHFCLFNATGQVTSVPIETFEAINPMALVLIVGDPVEIQGRLNSRDNKNYSVSDLSKMQNNEIEHSSFVASKLGIECIRSSVDDISQLIQKLAEFLY